MNHIQIKKKKLEVTAISSHPVYMAILQELLKLSGELSQYGVVGGRGNRNTSESVGGYLYDRQLWGAVY